MRKVNDLCMANYEFWLQVANRRLIRNSPPTGTLLIREIRDPIFAEHGARNMAAEADRHISGTYREGVTGSLPLSRPEVPSGLE